MSQRRYTVGVIGLGFGRAHIPAFQAHGCEVVGVCQRDQSSAHAVAKRYHVPQVFERWEQLLERARPDIAVVAAPPALHHTIAVEALAAGAHVLCEKPLAMDAEQALAMAEAARRARRVAMTCFNWRFPVAMQRFHALVEAGHVGRPFEIHARFLVPRWADETLAPTWRMDRAQAGHGVMGDLGVHLVDLVRWNFGEFTRVSAHAGIAHPSRTVPGGERPADTEDFCAVQGELASGAHVTLTASRVARAMNEHTLEAWGSAGILRYRLGREGVRWYRGELGAAAGSGALERVPVRSGLSRAAGEGDPIEVMGKTTVAPLVKRFLAAIPRGESPSPSFEDGLRAQAVLDAVLESAARGGWVAVKTPSLDSGSR